MGLKMGDSESKSCSIAGKAGLAQKVYPQTPTHLHGVEADHELMEDNTPDLPAGFVQRLVDVEGVVLVCSKRE